MPLVPALAVQPFKRAPAGARHSPASSEALRCPPVRLNLRHLHAELTKLVLFESVPRERKEQTFLFLHVNENSLIQTPEDRLERRSFTAGAGERRTP
jgi:hypothetical protein